MARFTVNTDQGDFIYETDGCALRGPPARDSPIPLLRPRGSSHYSDVPI